MRRRLLTCRDEARSYDTIALVSMLAFAGLVAFAVGSLHGVVGNELALRSRRMGCLTPRMSWTTPTTTLNGNHRTRKPMWHSMDLPLLAAAAFVLEVRSLLSFARNGFVAGRPIHRGDPSSGSSGATLLRLRLFRTLLRALQREPFFGIGKWSFFGHAAVTRAL